MDYMEQHRELIEAAELDMQLPTAAEIADPSLCSEIANAIMDSCAEELHACDPASLDAPTRDRMIRVMACLKGTHLPEQTTELPSKLVEGGHEGFVVNRGSW